jgi:Na+/phosphate symporter
MNAESLLQILSGLALLFLAQARIQRNLDELVFQRLRTSVVRLLGSRPSLWLMGMFGSLLLQASRIPIRLATKLVERRLLIPEQAFVLILGAALGSSIKGWFFAAQFQIEVALAFLITGMLLSLFRQTRLSLLGIPLIAAGCFWASLELIWQGLEPFLATLTSYQSMGWLDGSRLLSQLWMTLLGILILMFLRTGTLPLFIIMQLCWTGALRIESGAALILGLNMGMGLFPLERRPTKAAVSQLAWANLFNRFGMGTLILLFFPYFLQLASIMVPGPTGASFTAFRLAMFHMLVNLIMGLGGLGLMGLLFRGAQWITPGEHQANALILSRNVRRMLQRSPDYALKEVDNQLQIALEHTKQLTDQDLRLMTEKGAITIENGQESYLFETVQHSVYDLLLPLYHSGSESLRPVIHQSLRVLDSCSLLYEHAQQLRQELEEGLRIQLYSMPERLLPALELYQNEFNELWLAVLLRRPHYKSAEALEARLESLDEIFYEALSEEKLAGDRLIWIYRVLSALRQQSLLLYQVYHAQND